MPTKRKAGRPDVPDHVLKFVEGVRKEAVDWSPDMKYRKKLCLKAASWQAWADAAAPEAVRLKSHLFEREDFDRVAIGRWTLHRMRLPTFRYATELVWWSLRSYWKVESLPLSRYGREYGQVHFDDVVHIPILADAEMKPWMSPTPSEVMSQRAGVRAARGDVLVVGLGMGWLAKEIRRKKGVKSVTVLEKDKDIAAFFGPGLARAPGAPVRPVVVGDFYDWAAHPGDFDSVIVDIWDGCTDAGWDDKFQKIKADLKARGVKVWGWGDYVPRD